MTAERRAERIASVILCNINGCNMVETAGNCRISADCEKLLGIVVNALIAAIARRCTHFKKDITFTISTATMNAAIISATGGRYVINQRQLEQTRACKQRALDLFWMHAERMHISGIAADMLVNTCHSFLADIDDRNRIWINERNRCDPSANVPIGKYSYRSTLRILNEMRAEFPFLQQLTALPYATETARALPPKRRASKACDPAALKRRRKKRQERAEEIYEKISL